MILSNLSYGEKEHQLLDIYLPDGEETYPVFFYAHGGGLISGDKTEVKTLAEYLLSKGVATVSADYRLYPFARYPEYAEDFVKAIGWFRERYGDKIRYGVIGGSSAGAYLAMLLFCNEALLREIGCNREDFKGYLFNAGQPTSHFNYLKTEKKTDERRVYIDEAAPLYYIDKNFSRIGSPRVQFFLAEQDMVNRKEQTELLIRTMIYFGFPSNRLYFKQFDGYSHCCYLTEPAYHQAVYTFIKKCEE
ncbi:MAG: alpha/beta hydrolase [Clostridia bacterium]|nr:alpha/beta hydrolase [Clostridia bacterium]